MACSSLAAIEYLDAHPGLVADLREKTRYFREGLKRIGYKPLESESAIVPIIVGETAFAIALSDKLLKAGVFVTGFGFPVVPEGTARSACRSARRSRKKKWIGRSRPSNVSGERAGCSA